jgi:hypothetical protein
MIRAGFIAAVMAASLATGSPAVATDDVSSDAQIDEILAGIEAGDVCRDKDKLYRRIMNAAAGAAEAFHAPPSRQFVEIVVGGAMELGAKDWAKSYRAAHACPSDMLRAAQGLGKQMEADRLSKLKLHLKKE